MCNISNLGSGVLNQILTEKKGKNATKITATDINKINTNKDNMVSLDEMKAAVAKSKGVSVEELNTTLTEQDIGQLTEDAKDLTSFIRRGGEIRATSSTETNVFSFTPKAKFSDIKTISRTDNNENAITLSRGQSGEAIRQLKIIINNLNYGNKDFTPFVIDPKKPESSKFDDRLFEVIKKFQQNPEHELVGKTTEGVLDKATLNKLVSEAGMVIKDDVYTPYVPPAAPTAGVNTSDSRVNEVREKIYSQLTEKLKRLPEFRGKSDEELRQIIQNQIAPIGKELFRENENVIKESEVRTGWESTGYCASGVKEAMERNLNIPYMNGNAKDLDEAIRRSFTDVFAELQLTQDDVMNLPPEMGVVVVHNSGDYGHIATYSSNEKNGQITPVQMSDKDRNSFSYSGRSNFSVFIPIGRREQGDAGYVSDRQAYSTNSLANNVTNKKHDGMRRLSQAQLAQNRQDLSGYGPAAPQR